MLEGDRHISALKAAVDASYQEVAYVRSSAVSVDGGDVNAARIKLST